MKSMGIRSHT